ncbi:MAG: A/G-specific adenine glycosylase [Acidimicrobiales bacterium]
MQHALLDWWERRGRDLPWRRSRDPWRVLVSELMLQQTQVPRVAQRYDDLLERFPTPAVCAAAPTGDVVRAWAGLGYNRRAVNLHRCAREVVDRFDGRLPDDLSGLLSLPGIGPYTARAVLVFAFGHDIGLIDTNAGRFVARALGGRSLLQSEAQRLATEAVPAGRGWEWGQAVFDLGAEVCTRRSPSCPDCPARAHCRWFRAGCPPPDPVTGSAGIGRGQSRFAGSDRQGRGRLVDALRVGPVARSALARTMGWPDDESRAVRVAAEVVADGLATIDDADHHYRLPDQPVPPLCRLGLE